MQTIDFYGLARTAQERFVGSVNGSGQPEPILRAPSQLVAPRVWVIVSGVCFTLLVLVLVVGFGSLTSGTAILGAFGLAALVGLAGVGTFGVLRALALRRDHRTSPFRRGLYLFPVGLIDARQSTLQLHPIEELTGVYGPDVRGLTLELGGRSFSFPITDPEAIAAARDQLGSARTALGAASSSRDSVRPKAMAALDPLQGYANPLASSEKMARDSAPWATFAWVIAAVVGLVVGGTLWMVRNAKSDDSMYAHAVAAGDTASYRAYLEKGTRNAAVVTTVLLPRALLQEAIRVGTVAAIEQFIQEHPTSRAIVTEAKAALRTALLTELDAATKVGTLAALDDFAKAHPAVDVTPELMIARHGIYQAALARYMTAPPDKAPLSVAFVQRLIAWSEKKGPKVEVRFHSLRSKSMDKADRAAGQSRQWKGVVSLPSHYFDDAAEKTDRDGLAAAISQRFADVFPPDILTVSTGEPIADPDAPLPAQLAVPTLFVERSSVWAGSIQASQKPRGVFIGLDLGFDATFRTPDDPKPVRVKLEVWRVPELGAARDADKPEDVVYGAMRAKAYEQFQKKLIGTFFSAK